MGLLDRIKSALPIGVSEQGREDAERAIDHERQEREANAQLVKDKKIQELADDATNKKISSELSQKLTIRAMKKYESEKELPIDKTNRIIHRANDRLDRDIRSVAGKALTAIKQVANTPQTKKRHPGAIKEEKTTVDPKTGATTTTREYFKPSNPPGRPKSYKENRGSFKAPSYNKGKAYMPSPRSFGGVPGGMDNFMGGISPRRGAHPDPLAGLGRAGAFGDPFAGLGGINPNPKPAPKKPTTPAKKSKSKRGDVHITISRNPMIKGLGKIVGVPRGYKPRGKNPFDF